MREAVIERHLRKRVMAKGGLCLKWVSPGMRGVPDRIVMLPFGITAFVELKSTTGKLRLNQQRMLAKLDDLGMHVATLRSKKDVDTFMHEISELSP